MVDKNGYLQQKCLNSTNLWRYEVCVCFQRLYGWYPPLAPFDPPPPPPPPPAAA